MGGARRDVPRAKTAVFLASSSTLQKRRLALPQYQQDERGRGRSAKPYFFILNFAKEC